MTGKIRKASRSASRALLSLAEGVFSHSVDFVLWLTMYMAELSVPFESYGKVWRAQMAADRFLNQVNFDVIKHALATAKRQKWIEKNSRYARPEITKAGKRRLAEVLPVYDEKRSWDGRMHLVTYDIPEQRSNDRHLLRDYLRRIGCSRLQDSVWITPYNPIDIVRSFMTDRGLADTIIVSDMGKDGAIGDEDLRSLLVRIYHLEDINNCYKEWLKEFGDGRIDHWAMIRFLSILRDDPQLPFALLPKWWKGGEAYQRVKPLLKKVLI